MARKYYTLHVAPRTGARLREFNVSYPFVVFSVVAVLLLVSVLSVLTARHFYLRHQKNEIAEKKNELAQVRAQTTAEHIKATELLAKVEDIERTTAAFQRTFGTARSTPAPAAKADAAKAQPAVTPPADTQAGEMQPAETPAAEAQTVEPPAAEPQAVEAPAAETPAAETAAAENTAGDTEVEDSDLRKYNEFTYFSKLRAEVAPAGGEIRSRPEGLSERVIIWANTPAILPVQRAFLSSAFGWRADPFTGNEIYHNAVDLSSWYGEEVLAPADGIVIRTAESPQAGLFVEIFHGFGYSTRFAHLLNATVRAGQTVKRNDVIGRIGNTGKSTGPHLHYEVRFEGEPVDPAQFMADLRKAL